MKISSKLLKRIINEELNRILETGSFSVTGPDPSQALSTDDVIRLIKMGVDVSGIDASSPEAQMLGRETKSGPLTTEQLFALFEAGVSPQELENVDLSNLSPDHIEILIAANLY